MAARRDAHRLVRQGEGVLAESLGSVVFPLLGLLYEFPDGEWLDTDEFLSLLGLGDGQPDIWFRKAFVLESTAQLTTILASFGAADADWGAASWRSDEPGASVVFADISTVVPRYRLRLTPLGRLGVRNILVREGHTAPVAGELAAADAAALLDALQYYDPASFSAELTGWLAGRDEAGAVTELLEAIPGTDPDLAGRRVMALGALTVIAEAGDAREILRQVAASGPDGRRHVAAGALAGLGEEPASFRETGQQWLLVDRLTALRADDLDEALSPDLLEAIGALADDLWRCGHPAAADTMEATATVLRDSDKALAKRLRRGAHKARGR